MDKAYKIMLWVGWGLSFVLVVAWPLLALIAGVFSKGYFGFWVILSIIWGFIATVISEYHLPALIDVGLVYVVIIKVAMY